MSKGGWVVEGADVQGLNARDADCVLPCPGSGADTSLAVLGDSPPDPSWLVSVVVPAYNCAATLTACLRSLFAQSYPRDLIEIIVVDDGSTDATASACVSVAAEAWQGRFTLISQDNAGPAAARNAGIRAATGQIIAFTDADCVAAPGWLASLVRAFDRHPTAGGIGGPLRNAAHANTLVARYLLAADFYRHRTHDGEVDYLVTANAAFRRTALLAVSGFAERRRVWAEDADLSFRLVQSGYTLLLSSEGIVTHTGVVESLHAFARELYRYGFGNAILASGWPRWRRPSLQFVRHAGAVALAPWLALCLRRRSHVGWRAVLAFCPLIALEHAAFCSGLVGGWMTLVAAAMRHRPPAGAGLERRQIG